MFCIRYFYGRGAEALKGPLALFLAFENNSLKRLDNMREAMRGLSRLNDISCVITSTLPLQMALHFLLESTCQIHALHMTLYYFPEVICERMVLQRTVEKNLTE